MRFELIGGALCLDFANTVHDSRAEDPGEELLAISDLLQWAREAGVISSADHDRLASHCNRNPREAATALGECVAIRDLLLAIFAGLAKGRLPSSRRLSELNAALAQAPGQLRVRRNSDQIEAEWTSAADGLQRVLFPVLTSAAELLASQGVGRIRECASADCTWLFVDESRNRSRRWCDMSACGNRMKARRHHQKAKEVPGGRT